MKYSILFLLIILLIHHAIAQSANETKTVEDLDLNHLKAGSKHNFWVKIASNGIGEDILVPVIVLKGREAGPVVGIEAAIHGNELNGIAAIHESIALIDPNQLRGIIIAVPGVNIPAILNEDRVFPDLEDLNRIMPGKGDGNESQYYAHQYFNKIASLCAYMIDLHTASFGRINTNYVRADLDNPEFMKLAELQNADIILDSNEASVGSGGDATIRKALSNKGIVTITVELGDPQVFQKEMISNAVTGILNSLKHLNMISGEIVASKKIPVYCSKSYWVYTDQGGFLTIHPDLSNQIQKGQKIATQRNAFGEITKEYFAPEHGVIIGKSTNPVTPSGGRIIHLGILK